ncbi:hypothetical protein ACFYM5_38770 [Streptomyces sp. NPDC006706]|uniref:hypothetical protein n=1 Tax=Streptomyces sp. NPDC006706 TaxID=3364761 RepID=UPI00368CE8E8
MPGTRHLVEPTGFEEIYIEGGLRWRNPEDDLPGDFEATCTVHYAAIRRPMDPQAFITDLKRRMTDGLDRLSAALADGSAGAGPGSPRTRPRSPNAVCLLSDWRFVGWLGGSGFVVGWRCSGSEGGVVA